jgi:ParB/RepB/Spo0J family partition protein
MSDPSTAVLDVDSIEVEDGFNPRTRFDEDALSELEASIREEGLLSALTVRPGSNGTYMLIAGERRLIAAKRAGLSKVPAVIHDGSGATAAALAENLIREDLDPIETAQALSRLAAQEGFSTHKAIAEKVKKSCSWVSEHLRLLSLPEEVQRHIAAGAVPVDAERELRKVAKVSPRVAECACELVERGGVEGRDLRERFGEVMQAVAAAKFADKPTMISARGAALSELVPDPDQRKALTERLAAIDRLADSEDPYLHFAEAEIDAARAAGCLIEHRVDHGEWASVVAYVCDPELAADLAARVVERMERRAAEMAELTGSDVGKPDPEKVREERSAERKKAKRDAEAARKANLDLGLRLVNRRGAKSRKEHGLARAKALAAVVLADNERLSARGLRLILPQLQEVEVRTLKSGESREHVSYADPEQCAQYLAKRVEEARSANEVLELMADALIASVVADERELPQSRRVRSEVRARREVEQLLGAEIKWVRPRRKSRKAAAA